jgi:hypothetical protein
MSFDFTNNLSFFEEIAILNNLSLTELKESLGYAVDLENKIYKGSQFNKTQSNFNHEVAPFSFIYFVPPDCQNIDLEYFTVNVPTLSTINPHIRRMLLQTRYKWDRVKSVTNDANYYEFLAYTFSDGNSEYENQYSMPLATNLCELNITPTTLETNVVEFGENRFGYRQTIAGLTTGMIGNDLSLSFFDVWHPKLGHAVTYNLFKAWKEYISAVRQGIIPPGIEYGFNTKEIINKLKEKNKIDQIKINDIKADKNKFEDYGLFTSDLTINNKKRSRSINYMGSLYSMKLAEDGKSIVHWAKWTGIFPKSVDNSEYAGQNKDVKKITVNFQTQLYEEMDVNLLFEFNNLNLMEATNRNYTDFRKESGFDNNINDINGNKPYETFSDATNIKSLVVVDENFSREINKPKVNWNFYVLSGSDMNGLKITFMTDKFHKKSLVVTTKEGKRYYVLTPDIFYSVKGLNPFEDSGIVIKIIPETDNDSDHRIFKQELNRDKIVETEKATKKEVNELNKTDEEKIKKTGE